MAEPMPRARARWGTISREQVIQAATNEVLAGRYPKLTIRSLAASLNVAPMSLYRHVRDKADLMEQVADRLLEQQWQPPVGRDDARAWLTEAARRFRQFLVAQPAALEVFLRHPVTGPANKARVQAILAVLTAAGLSDQSARRGYAAMHTYTLGFAALESAQARWLSEHVMTTDPDLAWLAGLTEPGQFTEGLSYLLDGMLPAAAGAS
jgi:TetR/AcrR family transcriptional regulator, tetracycline repressor protein